jgi:hypothetical protein
VQPVFWPSRWGTFYDQYEAKRRAALAKAQAKNLDAPTVAAGAEEMRSHRKGPAMKDDIRSSKLVAGALFAGLCLLAFLASAKVHSEGSAWVVDNPTITIAGATATTSASPSIGSHEAHVQWTFGTVAGSYTTCTVQAKTTYDGSTWLTLGSAESITVTSSTVNAWDIYQVSPSTSAAPTMVLDTVSASAALAFGQLTQFVFACSGAYGTSAPVTITAIYR